MNNEKGYLSGQITGLKNYESIFKKYFMRAINLYPDIYIYNPAVNKLNTEGMTKKQAWELYMRLDIKILTDCDYILMIPNWWRSRGARFERKVAKKLGLKVIYLKRI